MSVEHRLTKGNLTIREVLGMSMYYYRKYDNKAERAKMDIISGKLVKRQNYEYDQSTKTWTQTGRDVKLEFLVRSDPISYKKSDTIKVHKYPVTILIHDVAKGVDSSFKWRTGSLKKPLFSKPGMDSQKIAEKNIRNGVQLNFFFYLEYVLWKYGLLFGRNWATRPPIKTNPKMLPFFDKTSFFVMKKIVIPILTKNPQLLMDTSVKNEDKKSS